MAGKVCLYGERPQAFVHALSFAFEERALPRAPLTDNGSAIHSAIGFLPRRAP